MNLLEVQGLPLPVIRNALDVDISRLIYDTHSTFNPLRSDSPMQFHVERIEGELAFLQIALPLDMARFYIGLLESLTVGFRVMGGRVRSAIAEEKAKRKIVEPAAIEAREKSRKKFTELVCSLYEKSLAQGHSRNDAIKQTNQALRLKEHPWAGYETVKRTLSSQGYFRSKYKGQPGKEVNPS